MSHILRVVWGFGDYKVVLVSGLQPLNMGDELRRCDVSGGLEQGFSVPWRAEIRIAR